MVHQSMTFGEWIRRARTAKSLARAAVDDRLADLVGVASGYTASIEHGRVKPPERRICEAFAEVLGLDPAEAWDRAAWERLGAFDPELAAWHAERVHSAAAEAGGGVAAIVRARPFSDLPDADGTLAQFLGHLTENTDAIYRIFAGMLGVAHLGQPRVTQAAAIVMGEMLMAHASIWRQGFHAGAASGDSDGDGAQP